ncbi:cupin domain-containing protein [Mycobacterium sp.]|jgi:quercetin dioxygenase-like cupin family protein|uniref:cupin domain-containing protein n=1 Tax=Mycobacterium sp. TaxID=1785 RepID=UPI002B75226D|nr:cupin domain-containing protein [Mycobacterium sp.]HTH84288.1 cupin domain-containing protein [Mycobacterium sp.]
MKTVRWFALLITATVPVSTALFPAAAATPSENADAVIVSQATVDGVDYITREITIQPGGSTGWHYHDGRVFGVVREGTLTRTMKDCSVVVSPEGSAVTEDSGADHTHIGRNLGPGPLALWVDYIEPAGTPLAVDMPDPGCG